MALPSACQATQAVMLVGHQMALWLGFYSLISIWPGVVDRPLAFLFNSDPKIVKVCSALCGLSKQNNHSEVLKKGGLNFNFP